MVHSALLCSAGMDSVSWLMLSFISPLPANTWTSSLTSGEQLSFSFDLAPNSCNIYFFPEGGDRETQIVRHGRLLGSNQHGCAGSQLLKPCGFLNEAVQVSCAGHFEVRDHNDDTALRVSLEIKREITCGFHKFLLNYCVIVLIIVFMDHFAHNRSIH